jgi:hypothetical protein
MAILMAILMVLVDTLYVADILDAPCRHLG